MRRLVFALALLAVLAPPACKTSDRNDDWVHKSQPPVTGRPRFRIDEVSAQIEVPDPVFRGHRMVSAEGWIFTRPRPPYDDIATLLARQTGTTLMLDCKPGDNCNWLRKPFDPVRPPERFWVYVRAVVDPGGGGEKYLQDYAYEWNLTDRRSADLFYLPPLPIP